jgi:hypothetical protein
MNYDAWEDNDWPVAKEALDLTTAVYAIEDKVFSNIGKLLLAAKIYDMHKDRALCLRRPYRGSAGSR